MAQPTLVKLLFGNPQALGRGFPARCVVLFERHEIPLDEGKAKPIPTGVAVESRDSYWRHRWFVHPHSGIHC